MCDLPSNLLPRRELEAAPRSRREEAPADEHATVESAERRVRRAAHALRRRRRVSAVHAKLKQLRAAAAAAERSGRVATVDESEAMGAREAELLGLLTSLLADEAASSEALRPSSAVHCCSAWAALAS